MVSTFTYPRWAIINFIVLTIFGLILRYLQLYTLPIVNYQFILHAHTHFAFSGWMFFSISLLISHHINGNKIPVNYKYVFIVAIISAYGMLLSFSLQGYQLVSIFFSTLFVLVTYFFTFLVFKGKLLKNRVNETAYKLIYGALIYLCISSLGPFALGPLAALGLKNTPYYQDAVYFYLHFQMNGFMFLAALGLFASTSIIKPISDNSRAWLSLFIYSTLPLYFIFTIWSEPTGLIWILASLGSVLNLLSWLMLCFNFRQDTCRLSILEKAALMAITLKTILQALICFHFIGEWAFLNRNLIIGYIHLLTLGVIMPLIINQFVRRGFLRSDRVLTISNWSYICLVLTYITLLFGQPLLALYSISIPGYQLLLFILCLLFLPVGFILLSKVKSASFSEM